MSDIIVNYAPYHKSAVKPRGFTEFCDMVETHGKLTGIWEFAESDARTGRIKRRQWNKNVITDQGASNILQRAINSSSATLPALCNNIYITNNSGCTTLNSALTNGQSGIVSLTVLPLPAAIPSGTNLELGYGAGTNMGGYNASGVLPTGTAAIVTSAGAAQGAVSISVSSFTTNAAYAIGSALVPLPTYADNPANQAATTANATTPVSSFSGNLATGAFTYTPTSGQGNRQLVVTFTFTNGGGTPVGTYTDAWLMNVNTGAAIVSNSVFAHEINTPMTCNTTTNLTVTVTIKI